VSAAAFGGSPEVLVMAGGEGRRLGALTSHTPKPMLPVAGRPLLQHILERLRDQGVEHVYLSVRHLSHVICEHFGNGRWLGIDIDYVVEDQPLGTAGAVGLLPAQTKPLLVVNGDLMTSVPVGALVAHHQAHGADLTVGHVEQRIPVPYGVVECRRLQVLRLQEKPDLVVTVIAGVYLLAPEVARSVPPDTPLNMPELITGLLSTGRVIGFALRGPWLDIGTPDTYAQAEPMLARTVAVLPAQRTVRAAVPVGVDASAGVVAGAVAGAVAGVVAGAAAGPGTR
jgi:NDP-sugar pyrophosphorylase family protein